MVSFSEIIEKENKPLDPRSILIVDAMNLAFRWKHNKKLDFEFDYIRTVESLAKSYDCGKVIITADQGGSSYRKKIYPEYKADRKERFANQTEQEKRETDLFFKEYERVLVSLADKYPVLRFKGVEADDIAAYIAKTLDNPIWLISSDRDWDLLINDRVSRFSYVTRKETTVFNWDEHYDIDIEDYLSYKCLMGDSGDNIPGIPLVGPVKAKELIETYGTGFDIWSHCPIDSKYKYIQNLNAHCDQILLNYELMDLYTYCEDAIGENNLESINNTLAEYLSEA
jgi:5'-3' exonuclease